jgi:hypothetical protein
MRNDYEWRKGKGGGRREEKRRRNGLHIKEEINLSGFHMILHFDF